MDDMRLAALLCTRLCHDVIGPAGATVNGIELLSDGSGAIDDEVIELVQQSASEVTRRLTFFRVALGVAATVQSLRDARTLAEDHLKMSKVDLDWPEGALDPGVPLPPVLVPLSLNLILCATETLPRGGQITVTVASRDNGVALGLEATGPTIKLDPDVLRSLAGESDLAVLDARSIIPYLAAKLAAQGGGTLDVSHTESSAIFSATLPHTA